MEAASLGVAPAAEGRAQRRERAFSGWLRRRLPHGLGERGRRRRRPRGRCRARRSRRAGGPPGVLGRRLAPAAAGLFIHMLRRSVSARCWRRGRPSRNGVVAVSGWRRRRRSKEVGRWRSETWRTAAGWLRRGTVEGGGARAGIKKRVGANGLGLAPAAAGQGRTRLSTVSAARLTSG